MIKGDVVYQNKLGEELLKKYENGARSIVFQASSYTRNEVVKNIAGGSKTGKLYKRGQKVHQASAAGEYPATDTGFLVNNIHVKLYGQKSFGAFIESRAPYSKFLEYGTVNMAARPFLKPALEATRPLVRKLLKQLVGKKK